MEARMHDRLLQFFACDHLPIELAVVSRPFKLLAEEIVHNLPANAERTTALRKLLEAKDCAVRAKLYVEPTPESRAVERGDLPPRFGAMR